MKQYTLFTQKQLGKLARPKEIKPKKVRTWNTYDLFPFGPYKGQTLSSVARVNPSYIEWWRSKSNVQFSKELTQIINQSKFLSA